MRGGFKAGNVYALQRPKNEVRYVGRNPLLCLRLSYGDPGAKATSIPEKIAVLINLLVIVVSPLWPRHGNTRASPLRLHHARVTHFL